MSLDTGSGAGASIVREITSDGRAGDIDVARYRDVMGATNPEKADAGTIRKDFALNMGENSVHGSDAPETAAIEIATTKLEDLNANDLDAASKIIAGTARSMGITVKD